VNLKYLPFGWEKKGPTTRFATDVEKIEKRAVDTRVWLRNLAKEEANEDAHIVVVTHGTFAHFLVQDFEGMDGFGGFEHGEWRSYHFKSLREMNDQKVKLVELESSRAKRVTEKRAGAEPLSKHEKTMAYNYAKAFVEKQAAETQYFYSCESAKNSPKITLV